MTRPEDSVPGDLGEAPWTREEMIASLEEFVRVYDERPIRNNAGGMQFNHCFAAWFVLRYLQPPLVVESGVLKGLGTWLIEQACPEAEIFSFDVNFSRRQYHSSRASYHEHDLAVFDWTGRDLGDAVFLFDDHCNSYRRLSEMYWLGGRRAIFEDNYPVGEGDCYSLRHLLSGQGRDHIQQSVRARKWYKQLRYRFMESVLSSKRVRHEQTVLVSPEQANPANLLRRLKCYVEVPPAWLPPMHDGWQVEWAGTYATRPPLAEQQPDGFDGLYGYIVYVEID